MELTKVIYFSLLIFISGGTSVVLIAYVSYKVRRLFFGNPEILISDFVLRPMIIALISSRKVVPIAKEILSKKKFNSIFSKRKNETFENKIIMNDAPKRMKRYFAPLRFIQTDLFIRNKTEDDFVTPIEKIAV
ncbi:MAG: hypothetical protein V1720_10510 [bacterium]